jgi:copper chaperone
MKETLLDVKGMTCSSCVRHIDHALKELDGVQHVEVRMREGRVIVKHAESVDAAKLVGAVKDAGYDAQAA